MMLPRETFARYLLLKGSAMGCVGSAYWLFGQAQPASVLLVFALGYVGAAWALDRRVR